MAKALSLLFATSLLVTAEEFADTSTVVGEDVVPASENHDATVATGEAAAVEADIIDEIVSDAINNDGEDNEDDLTYYSSSYGYYYYGGDEPGYEHMVVDDSDYLYLYTDHSTLPFMENEHGVFARFDIPAGEIICEYRGPAYTPDVSAEVDQTKSFVTTLTDGHDYHIIGDSVCSLINDAAYILKEYDPENDIVTLPYTSEELKAFEESEELHAIPTTEGFEYNAEFQRTALGKVFIVATKEIKAESEIFFSYGTNYWIPYMRSILEYNAQQCEN